MNVVKFPVIVSANNQQSYKWLTLEQVNERFIVVNNRLVANNVEPLSLDYCQVLLDRAQKSLLDSQKELDDLYVDVETCKNSKLFISEYLQPMLHDCKQKIEYAQFDIDFLTKAIDFLKS